VLPVIVANTIAYFVSQRLHPVPFFTVLAREEGVDLPSAEEFRAVRAMRVEDAMQAPAMEEGMPPAPRLYPDLPLDSALRVLGEYPVLPVVSRSDPTKLIGTITLADVHRAYGIGASED
jgi:CBS domain-containing protein